VLLWEKANAFDDKLQSATLGFSTVKQVIALAFMSKTMEPVEASNFCVLADAMLVH
jgi:hypothetical protein